MYVPIEQLGSRSDGKNHINIYSKGQTELGRDLSNFATLAVKHPTLGEFATVEGFWHFRKHPDLWTMTLAGQTLKLLSELRHCSGFRARCIGKELGKGTYDDTFADDVRIVLQDKLDRHPQLRASLIASTLPFVHYYEYGKPDNPVIRIPSPGPVDLVEFWTTVREQLQSAAPGIIAL